jgi:hypothetical protein
MPKGIPGTTTVGRFTIDWYEIKDNDGPSPRGICVTLKDHPRSKFDFRPFEPNPHSNPTYNIPNNQKKFYLAAANFIAQGFDFTADDVTVPYSVPRKPYTPAQMNKLIADPLGRGLVKKEWGKLIQKEQDKFVADYTKKVAEFRKSKETEQATAAWVKHVKAKGGKSFSWETINYKLPAPAPSS